MDIIHKLSCALAHRGHDVTICAGNYELDQDFLSTMTGVKVKVHRSWFNKHGIFLMPELVLLDIAGYDVIHFHCYRSFQNAVLGYKAIRHSIPYVIDAHGSTVSLSGGKQLLRFGYDRLIGQVVTRHASCFVAETGVGVAEYERLGIDTSKIRRIHPFFDVSEFDHLPAYGLFRNKYGVGGQFLILFLGRLHQAKGIETLVTATKQLADEGTNVCLAIVGQDDGFLPVLERIVEDNRIEDKVFFTGFLCGDDKLSALVDADVLIQPSRNEGGARPSLEASLCGTSVIVTAGTGAGDEIARTGGGYLVEYGNPRGLVDRIRWIMDNREQADHNTRTVAGYVRANLSAEAVVTKYEKMYQEVSG